MNNILSEKEYQHKIIGFLRDNNGYVERKATNYDRLFALDREMLFAFLEATQSDTMQALQKIYKSDLEETLVNVINQTVTSQKGSLIETIKNGIEMSNYHIDLFYSRPATSFNKTLNELYSKNIFSVMEEVWCSDNERVDLVIFLNGLAIISFELKCNHAGQSYRDAITQYRTMRDATNACLDLKQAVLSILQWT